MTEYWVSKSKHYCKYCNTWIADNKVNIQHHESSVRHKTNVQMFNKKHKNEKYFGARDEEDLKRQLQDIEKAASQSVSQDRSEFGHLFQKAEFSSKGSSSSLNLNRSSTNPKSFRNRESSAEEDEQEVDVKKDNGLYCIRGQYYLEGPPNEAHLRVGVTCQIFVEDLDDWFDAIVVARKETHVPHTTLSINVFDVQYILPPNSSSNDEDSHSDNNRDVDNNHDGNDDDDVVPNIVLEENVKSERLRLCSDEHGNRLHVDGTSIDRIEIEKKPIMDQNTGVSQWTTVSVRLVDEKEEAEQRARQEEEEKILQAQEEAARVAALESKLVASEAEDAQSSYDPYNTNLYRGIPVVAEKLHAGTVDLTNGEEIVSFKRKRMRIDSPSISKPANDDDDDDDASTPALPMPVENNLVASESKYCNSEVGKSSFATARSNVRKTHARKKYQEDDDSD